MGRSTLTISEDHKDRFDSFKDGSETVDEAFGRLLDAATGELTTDDSDGVDTDELLARLDDLQAELPKRTADAVESRLTRH